MSSKLFICLFIFYLGFQIEKSRGYLNVESTIKTLSPYAINSECLIDIFVKFNASNVIPQPGQAFKKIDNSIYYSLFKFSYNVQQGDNQISIWYQQDSTSLMEAYILNYNCQELFQYSLQDLPNSNNVILEFNHDAINDYYYVSSNIASNSKTSFAMIANLQISSIPGYNVNAIRVVNNKYFELYIQLSTFTKTTIESSISLVSNSKTFNLNTFEKFKNSTYVGPLPTYIKRGVYPDAPNVYIKFLANIQDESLYIVNNIANGYRCFPVLTNGTEDQTYIGYFPYQLGTSPLIDMDASTKAGTFAETLSTGTVYPPSLSLTSFTAQLIHTFGTDRKIYYLLINYVPIAFSFSTVYTSKYTLPYLYGFQKLDATHHFYDIYILNSPFSANTESNSLMGSHFFSINFPSTATQDTIPPSIKSLTLTHFKGYQFIVSIHATDNMSGIFNIVILGQTISYVDLYFGSIQDGFYEKLITIQQVDNRPGDFFATVNDRAGNIDTFYSGDILSVDMNPFPENPLNDIINDITGVSFENSMVNLSGNFPVSNKLYITISNFSACSQYPVIFKPTFQSIEAHPLLLKITEFEGYYVNSEGRYVVEFSIPSRLVDKYVNYELTVAGVIYTSTLLKQLFPNTSQLYIYSDAGDELPPYISSLIGYISATNASYPTIGFQVKINYQIVPWKTAEFSIITNFDPYPRNITKTFSDINPSGSIKVEFIENNGLYCLASQTYKIVYIRIVDESGHASFFKTLGDPVMPYQFSVFGNESFPLSIDYLCQSTSSSVSSPQLDSFEIVNYNPGTVLNIGVTNTLQFILSVKSTTLSPIDERHVPLLFLTDIQANIIQTSLSTIIDKSVTTMKFGGQITIPIGFGMDGLLVSISNVADSFLNFATFTPDDLTTLGYIPTSFTIGGPFITSTSTIRSLGDTLTIYGRGFGVDGSNTKVFIEGTNFQLSILTAHTVALVVYNVPAALQAPFKIFVTVNSVQSNIYTVPIAIPPTQTPVQQTCPGSPVCGGPDNGVCDGSGVCQCKGSWTGKACLSQQINIPQPNVSTTDPSAETTVNGTLPDGSQISFRNLISVVELRELNFKNEIQRNFTFTQWLFTNTSTSSTTSYLYATSIDNNSTNVTVSVQWYPTETTITFANEEIRMLPSTMKYTIEISAFDFQSSTNRLQLVMNAQTISDNTGTCVTRTPENQQDSDLIYEYFKLQIDNHSLYGRFIKRALVDFRPTAISNTLLQSTTQNTSSLESQQLIGINIPYFNNKVIIDPDFSVLVDNTPIDDSNCPSSSKGLTKSQLAGIIIASSFAGIFLISLMIYFIMKKTNTAVEFRYKLRKLGKMSP
ncbi:hypothetical protein DLAC_11469 [Tieghemostelium lacteum]|uniref:Uncharacterized protein n=1 Tax=Tieghemostelium lacteum TaxID=361077 RepID=A0A152A875_TIELA|nr:hypothetical protein DLAC_11469 [Tieghemostelium lacteum]|eukprot:KYR02404.1 hypothetical protein DLAC_11469 [Tieghemostelium lacteum]